VVLVGVHLIGFKAPGGGTLRGMLDIECSGLLLPAYKSPRSGPSSLQR